jgi:hypothetical protein
MAAVMTRPPGQQDLYRTKPNTPSLVEVPPARFLMIDGSGTPGGERFQQSLSALYGIAYTVKFSFKKAGKPEFKVSPLEGLFGEFVEPLQWTLLIRMPDAVDASDVDAARAAVARKHDLPTLADVRYEVFDEGLCAQVLYVGPYAEESATIAALHQFIHDQGRELRGRHHEIYLSAPGRTKPERLKTVLRQPVA